MLDSEPRINDRPQEKLKNSDVYYLWVPEEVLASLKGPCGEVKAEYRQGETGPGACAFVRVYRWGILVFLGNARLVNSDLKSEILLSPKGVLSKECTGEDLLTRAVGKVVSRTCISL